MPSPARLAALLFLTAGAPAAAQMRAPAGVRPVHRTATAAAAIAPAIAPAPGLQPPVARPGVGRLVAGGLLGGAAGLVVGAGAGAYVGAARECRAEQWVCTWHGLAVGAAVGTSLGIPIGTHVAGTGRGRLGSSVLASLAIGAAGVGLLAATHFDPPWAPAILIGAPVAQLAVSAALERGTPRE